MSKQTFYVLGILATILFGALLYNKFCCQDCCSENSKGNIPVTTGHAEMGEHNRFNLNGNDFEYSCHDNFRFLSNGFSNIQPVSDSINTGISQLKTFFDKNPNQKLHITGYALNSEKNTTVFPNLGFARANDIKSYFVSKGFDASRFETHGELREDWAISGDTLLGPLDFKIKNSEAISDAKSGDWNALKEKINADPLILYFKTNQSEINLTADERQKIADLKNYLENVAEAKVICIGHTDNIGDRKANINLGQHRADFAREYLIKKGIVGNKIESSSIGPDQPIADNKSVGGRAKNRRTVVSLK
jgi:OOP family OmpA-OmpF porin